MECIKCGAALGREDQCPACGTDVKLYKRIVHTSNRLYNEGLERAKVRDLSGAVNSLRSSLKWYKMNITARNLLGLVYFEMGETVDAISQWVISRSLMPEQNPAEQYLASVQTNGNRLDSLNQTIKKYNQALVYCRQDSQDLAIIQLKKVLSLNPRLVKGHQLLALLYMQEGNFEMAKKSLRNAGRIDANNTTTLRYLREVNQRLHKEQPAKKKEKKEKKGKEKEELVSYQSGNETIIHPATFKDNSVWSTILNIVIGAAIGVLVTWFLIVPGMRQDAVSDANLSVREANDTISTKNQTIKTLEAQIEALEGQVEELSQLEDHSPEVAAMYEQLLTAYQSYLARDYTAAGTILEKLDAASLNGKAKEIYDMMSEPVNEQNIATLYTEGSAAYNARNFDEAVEKLQRVVDFEEGYEDGYAMYYLAHSYRELGNKENALRYYQRFVELKPGTKRANASQNYIQQLQAAE